MSRYKNRRVVTNKTSKYKDTDIFENRGVKKIVQYSTPRLKKFTKKQYNSVPYTRYYWKNGDRFWKLAAKFYDDPKKWWIIARWNFTPTESHVSEGDEIRIPKSLRKVMEILDG